MTTLRRILQISKQDDKDDFMEDEPALGDDLKAAKIPKKPRQLDEKEDSDEEMEGDDQSEASRTEDKTPDNEPSFTIARKRGRPRKKLENDEADANLSSQEPVSWIQCDKCKKWYEIPRQLSAIPLPKSWFCSMITWDSKGSEQCEKRANDNLLGYAKAYSPQDNVEGQVQWVECDRCKKWRKVPSFVKTEKLPLKWFCYLNVYDPVHSNCSVPQERYTDQEDYTYTDNGSKRPGESKDEKRKTNKQKLKASDNVNLKPAGFNTNKLIKTKLREKTITHACVYGIEEKRLKKSKRNPTTFKELVWWYYNDYSAIEFDEEFRIQTRNHFVDSSLCSASLSQPSAQASNAPFLLKRRRSVKSMVGLSMLDQGSLDRTTFSENFLSDDSSRVGRLLAQEEEENGVSIFLSKYEEEPLRNFLNKLKARTPEDPKQ